MILIDSHCNIDLDALAKTHFQELINPQNQDGSYHATQSLIGRISSQMKVDILVPVRIKFWNYFLINHYRNLDRITSGRPEILAEVIIEIENLVGHNILSNNLNYNQASLTSFGKIVKSVFGYEIYRDNGSARENVEQFNLNYCPYCNKQELESIQRTDNLSGNTRITALYQLDHFYPRARFPYLAVSFFNLIPGCSPCNAQLKLDKDFNIFTHVNPFHKSFDDYFKFKLSKVVVSSLNEVELEIENKSPHSDNSIIDFQLLQRYNNQNTKKRILDQLYALKNRSEAVRKSYMSQITGLFRKADIPNEVLLKSQGVPTKKDEISNYPMGKMKRDICIQLDLLK
ncbi:hypothetical protein GCM10009430_22730 [Aquimarina litoralis]|uniref:HNH endonuclease n=1 Tax=Aquimarina litoralis TaxID=584605 RepID=A0ABN1IUR5_9FLAO